MALAQLPPTSSGASESDASAAEHAALQRLHALGQLEEGGGFVRPLLLRGFGGGESGGPGKGHARWIGGIDGDGDGKPGEIN